MKCNNKTFGIVLLTLFSKNVELRVILCSTISTSDETGSEVFSQPQLLCVKICALRVVFVHIGSGKLIKA